MLLHFVSDPAIDAKERRQIRSHVMRGKNAGKPRAPRKTLLHRDLETTVLISKVQVEGEEVRIKASANLCPYQPLWNELSLTSYPYYIGPEKERFVYQRLWIIAKALYPPEFCSEVNLSQYAWFQYVLEDTAYFHVLLAICFSFKTHFGGPRHISPEALRHVSQAYRMTNERLSGSDACSDQAIAVVTMLAIYQRMHHQQAIGLVHFQGLRRMVELRGGLAKLASDNRGLAQKPWRLALEFALQDGAPVSFSLGDVEDAAYSTGFRSLSLPSLARGIDIGIGIDPTLFNLLSSITQFTQFLNTTANTTKLDALDYSDAVCFLLHRLLTYASLHNQHHLTSMDNLIHLSLVAVMTRLIPEYGHNQARYDLLENQLRGALQRIHAPSTVTEHQVLLWAVFVAYVTILGNFEDETMLTTTARTSLRILNLHGWEDVRSVLCRFAWIGAFYDKAGLKFFRQITGKSVRDDLQQTED